MFIILFIAAIAATTGSILEDGALLFAAVLLFVSPFLAIWYFTMTWNELQLLKEVLKRKEEMADDTKLPITNENTDL